VTAFSTRTVRATVIEPATGPRFGISLLRVHPRMWLDVALEAERLGFESIWMSDHVVIPEQVDVGGYPEERLPIDPRTPMYDVMVYLASIAALTSRLRLGTYVYQLGLRHPVVAARAITTLDVVSKGRVELGVGAGWSRSEWDAVEVDFASRGARLEECLDVLDGVWTRDRVSHRARNFSFHDVTLEPKPVQQPRPPLHIGGESPAAFRRAVIRGDGWIGMHHTPESVVEPLGRLRSAAADLRMSKPLQTTVASHPGDVDVSGWRASGVDRVIIAPWQQSRDALAGMRTFASRHLGSGSDGDRA
jgi:probable F420-dependent oxidoreductase